MPGVLGVVLVGVEGVEGVDGVEGVEVETVTEGLPVRFSFEIVRTVEPVTVAREVPFGVKSI